MDSGLTSWLRRNAVALYFCLAIAFSWAIYLPLVAVRQGWTAAPLPFSIHYLASFGPALAAMLVTALVSGRDGLRELWGRIVRWPARGPYALFGFLSPLVLFVCAGLAMRLVEGAWPDLRLLGQANYLPYLGVWVLPLWLITFGFGEEIGWRGFALPRLQKSMSVSRATVVLGLLWTLWHVPSFFYHEKYVGMGLIMVPGIAIGVLFGAVILTWLYNGSGGSVLIVAIWHALFDLLSASAAGRDFIPIVTTIGVIAWGLLVANVEKSWGFRFQLKQTL